MSDYEIDMFGMVREWHEAFNVLNSPEPTLDVSFKTLRETLIIEEFKEVLKAFENNDIENLSKELADLIWVCCGAALTFGIPLDKVFEEVYRSNMSKLGDDGKPVLREDGKILKGPNYLEADVKRILWPDLV